MRIKEKVQKHFAGIVLCSFFTGLLVMHIGRFHYSLVYLPQYHGSWTKSLKTLWDLDAWWSYLKSPVGLTVNLSWLLFCVIIPGVIIGLIFLEDKINSNRKTKRKAKQKKEKNLKGKTS